MPEPETQGPWLPQGFQQDRPWHGASGAVSSITMIDGLPLPLPRRPTNRLDCEASTKQDLAGSPDNLGLAC